MKEIVALAKPKAKAKEKLLVNKKINLRSIRLKINSSIENFILFWLSLNFAQRCYVSALIFLFISLSFENTLAEFAVVTVAVTGLVTEFWPSFIRFWHSLPGKAIIVLFYATIANFALVNAAGIVNDITGVVAEKLPYTHNLAVLLIIPSLFIISSLLVLLVINLLMPLYLLVLLILKPFGIHSLVSSTPCRFPYTTALIRYLFTFAMTMAFLFYSLGLGVVDKQLLDMLVTLTDSHKTQQSKAVTDDVKSGKSTQAFEFIYTSDDESKNEIEPENIQLSTQIYQQKIRRILSFFIYEFEADERSRCEHSSTSRVIELNDYEILAVTVDETDSLGYRYQVEKCISPAFPIDGIGANVGTSGTNK